jgi:tetratricopeptide (TPR) repeat protein
MLIYFHYIIKLSITLFFVLAFSSTSICQSKKDSSGIDFFNIGLNYYEQGNLDSAVIIWEQIVEQKIGKGYDVYGNAFFNIPTVYFYQKKYKKAKDWFLKIIDSDLRDSDETGSLMEPHTNYKHKAALSLASLYAIDADLEKAIEWVYAADTLYRYWGFEGSASNVNKRKAYIMDLKIRLLSLSDKQEQLIHDIIVELICSNRFEEIFFEAEYYLLNNIDKQTFKKELDKGLQKVSINQLDSIRYEAIFFVGEQKYTIPIWNERPTQWLPHYWSVFFIKKEEEITPQNFAKAVKKKKFYKNLH